MGLLAVAAHRGVIRQAEVGARLQLDNSTLSRNLDRMRANGWLDPAPEADARVHSHRLTPAGRALFERAVPGWRAAQRQASELLGGSGIEALDRLARKSGFTT
jgi:DNA-binding MarR family transcriptional regulator